MEGEWKNSKESARVPEQSGFPWTFHQEPGRQEAEAQPGARRQAGSAEGMSKRKID